VLPVVTPRAAERVRFEGIEGDSQRDADNHMNQNRTDRVNTNEDFGGVVDITLLNENELNAISCLVGLVGNSNVQIANLKKIIAEQATQMEALNVTIETNTTAHATTVANQEQAILTLTTERDVVRADNKRLRREAEETQEAVVSELAELNQQHLAWVEKVDCDTGEQY